MGYPGRNWFWIWSRKSRVRLPLNTGISTYFLFWIYLKSKSSKKDTLPEGIRYIEKDRIVGHFPGGEGKLLGLAAISWLGLAAVSWFGLQFRHALLQVGHRLPQAAQLPACRVLNNSCNCKCVSTVIGRDGTTQRRHLNLYFFILWNSCCCCSKWTFWETVIFLTYSKFSQKYVPHFVIKKVENMN
jgi:hypothetical protein